jgi:hypothetical protein
MIPWQGNLKFWTYSPGKIKKYGALVRMVYEAVLGRSWSFNTVTFRQKLRPKSSHLSRKLL